LKKAFSNIADKEIKKMKIIKTPPRVITNYQQLNNKAKLNIEVVIGQFLAREARELTIKKGR